jgi:transposase-like protein
VGRLETEERLIARIDGATLTLDRPLAYFHLGSDKFRSEVANLSRNVVIESADLKLRGHTMYHKHSAGSLAYAEFRHLGKEGWCRHNVANFPGESYNTDEELSSTSERLFAVPPMTDDLSRFCCQNADCPDYGRRGQGNLRVAFRYGRSQRRMLACRTCQQRFSERKGTPLFDARLPDAKVLDVLAHLHERCGVRQTSRLTGVEKNTVVRYALRAGEHAQQLHDELLAFSPSHPRRHLR